MITKIAHVGIATESIGVVAEFYKLLGLEMDTIEVIKEQNVKVAMMKVGESAVELIEPLDEDSPVARFISKRGEGIHHLTFEVDDIEAQLETLRQANIKLIDERPRPGAEGSLIAFIHPHSTGGVLVELCPPPPLDEDAMFRCQKSHPLPLLLTTTLVAGSLVPSAAFAHGESIARRLRLPALARPRPRSLRGGVAGACAGAAGRLFQGPP